MTDYAESFAKYYAILVQHKDYEGEVKRLREALEEQGITAAHDLLSVGCGIGTHERLLAPHYAFVQGVDRSEPMIAYGNKQTHQHNLALTACDVSQLDRGDFAAALSLFNVANCIETLEDLQHFFSAIAQRLCEKGLFVFEVWNAAETNATPPVAVTREYVQETVSLKRACVPTMHSAKHLELVYSVDGVDNAQAVSFTSTHPIFLHTTHEIEAALAASGFENIEWFSALSAGMEPMTATDRMLLCQARKVAA